MKLVAPAYVDEPSTNLPQNRQACQKKFEIDVSGGFFADHLYSCVIVDEKNQTHQSPFVRSALHTPDGSLCLLSQLAPVSNTSVRCPFNTSNVILFSRKGDSVDLNTYQLQQVLQNDLRSGNTTIVSVTYPGFPLVRTPWDPPDRSIHLTWLTVVGDELREAIRNARLGVDLAGTLRRRTRWRHRVLHVPIPYAAITRQ